MKEEISRDKCRIRGVHVSRCDKCNISLCLACFKPIHTISDVKQLKSDVKKNYKQQKKVRGTTKAAVLTGDPEAPDLVAFSVFDTKPVHFLSMACTGLKWIEKRKKVFDRESNKNVSMAFLRCEVTDTYNNGMNGVDIADQLRGTYRFDCWMQKRKWWWSIWMWGLQVLLVNAYLLYRSAHIIIWKTERKKNT